MTLITNWLRRVGGRAGWPALLALGLSLGWAPETGARQPYSSFAQGKLEGLCCDFYPTGRVKLQYVAADGLIDGYLYSYYPTGAPKRKDLYDHGRLIKGQYFGPEGELGSPTCCRFARTRRLWALLKCCAAWASSFGSPVYSAFFLSPITSHPMRISTLLTAGLLLSGLNLPAASAQTFTDPGTYNNAIVAEQLIMQKKCLRYISKSAHSENERKIEARRQDVVAQNKLSLAKISHMPGFQGNTEFRDRAKAAFQQMLSVYSTDYQKVNTLAVGRAKSLEAMQHYFDALEAAENKLEVAGDSVQAAQQRFAAHFKMTVSEDREARKLNEVIRQVSEVNTYQHKIFLAYFRLERANARLTDGLNAQDAKAFEAARQQLETETDKALAELDAIPAFRGKDTQYRDATRNYAKFYVIWTGNQFKKMTELIEQKDHLTQVDVDAFNGYIAAYNKQSHSLLDAYNRAANNFQSAYIPVFND